MLHTRYCTRLAPAAAPAAAQRRRAALPPRVCKLQAGHHAHRHELLEQQLARVGHEHLAHGRVLVHPGSKGLLLEVGHRKEARALAHVHAVRVTLVKQALLEEGGGAVRDDAVALHLTKPQPAVARAALHRLPVQHLQRAARARVDLEVHHVLQALVVGGVQEDLSLQLAARVSVVHDLPPSVLVPHVVKVLGDLLHRDVREGRGVTLRPDQRSHLAHERLHQVADGHARGDGVGVHNQVGHDALRAEGHVLLRVRDAHRALLPVARRKLVAHLRDADGAHADLDEALPAVVGGQHHLVDHAALRPPQRQGRVPLGEALHRAGRVGRQRDRLAHDDVLAAHARARRHQPVLVQLVVRAVAHAGRAIGVGHLNLLARHRAALLLLVLVGAEEDGSEEASVDGALVHHERVLLVVPRVARDGHDGVDACGQLAELEVLHGARGDQRLLRVVQQEALCVHAVLVVGAVHAHGLLAHGGLVGVTRRLVVVGEGDDGRAHAQDHGRVDLAVRVRAAVRALRVVARGLQVLDGHGDHGRLLLLRVHVLDVACSHQVVPAVTRLVAVLQRHDVLLGDEQPLVVHNKQRARGAAVVGEQAQLLERDVVNHAHLRVEVHAPPQQPQRAHQCLRVAVDADPLPVHKHLCGLGDDGG
mmetsp:Transcript_37572/g.94847  ORF Transcript_37572/g.94847 Transcript_37572/m.94847 type:complete len:646 (-) Transcript_37572:1836-3773(-)